MKRRRNDSSWRRDCLEVRGLWCRSCGTSYGLEIDHLIPRSQGGLSIVENGLLLCRDCHRKKTEHRMLVDPMWLDEDQLEWLASEGHVMFDEDTGEPYGRHCRLFDVRRKPWLTHWTV